MGGFSTMTALCWRGNRTQILCWTLGLAVVFVATALSLDSMYSTPAELATYRAATESGTALFAINGKPYGLDNIGGVIAYEFGFISALAFPLMAIHLVTRMTRREEESGRVELLRAGSIGRTAALAAALTVVGAALLVITAVTVATLLALDLNRQGAVLYSLSIALLAWSFAAVAAACAQVVAASRTVTALCLAILAVTFLARGVGDVRGNALVWLSPIGWAEQTQAFGNARWWPLALLLTFTIAVTALAALLAAHRDLGAGVFSSRRGPLAASPILLQPFGFALRKQRGAIAAWSVIGMLVALAFGALTDAVHEAIADNETMRTAFGGSGEADAYLAFVVVLLALIVAGYAVQAVGRTAEEEPGNRLEPLLAGSRSRTRWLTAEFSAVVLGTIVVALLSGLALGASAASATGDTADWTRLATATLAYLPATLVLAAIPLALYGIRPAWQGLGWAVFAAVAVIATLADTLRLPQWTRHLSPFDWVGRVPQESLNPWAPILSLLLAAALATAGIYAFTRRDIPTHHPATPSPLRRVLRLGGKYPRYGSNVRHAA